jgi:hypothetical protein
MAGLDGETQYGLYRNAAHWFPCFASYSPDGALASFVWPSITDLAELHPHLQNQRIPGLQSHSDGSSLLEQPRGQG